MRQFQSSEKKEDKCVGAGQPWVNMATAPTGADMAALWTGPNMAAAPTGANMAAALLGANMAAALTGTVPKTNPF
ncbi:unnamed protein product [Gadus morhua 'NCC']